MSQPGHREMWSSKRSTSSGSIGPSRESVITSTSSWHFIPTAASLIRRPIPLEVALQRSADLGPCPVEQHSLVCLGDVQSVSRLLRGNGEDVPHRDQVTLAR